MMIGAPEESLKHQAFFIFLEHLHPSRSGHQRFWLQAWQASSAGLALLQAADRWVRSASTAELGYRFEALRRSMDGLSGHDPLHSALMATVAVFDEVHRLAPDARDREASEALARAFLRYAEELEAAVQFDLAEDVCSTIDEVASSELHPEIGARVQRLRGHVHRQNSRLLQAARSYGMAARLGHAASDCFLTLRGRIGLALVTAHRGNLPEAERRLRLIVRDARARQCPQGLCLALHDLGNVLYSRGQYDAAASTIFEALEYLGQRDPGPILNDLGVVYVRLHLRERARNIFATALRMTSNAHSSIGVRINLMELAADEGNLCEFERLRAEIAGLPSFPRMHLEYILHVGRGYAVLGDLTQARNWLELAVATASNLPYELPRFEAEATLASLGRMRPSGATVELDVHSPVDPIAASVRVFS